MVDETRSTWLVRIYAVLPKGEYPEKSDIVFLPMIDLNPSDLTYNEVNLTYYEVKRLRNSFKKFYGRYPDLIGKYQRSVKDMVADSFPD